MGQINNDFMNNHLNSVVHGDSMELMKEIPDESVDLIISDPPYSKSKKIGDIKEHRAFAKKWLISCRRILKPNGTLFTITSRHCTNATVVMAQHLGYGLVTDIIWSRPGYPVTEEIKDLAYRHESITWFTKEPSVKYTLNQYVLRKLSTKSPKGVIPPGSVWTMFGCTKEERLLGADGKMLHPQQRPWDLIKHLVLLASNRGELVFDPFSGTGTVCAVAKAYKRKYIGIEKESEYIRSALERVERQREEEEFPAPAPKKAPPKGFKPKPGGFKPRVPYDPKKTRNFSR